MKQVITKSEEETRALARKMAAGLKPGAILGLIGELGSGKTTFVQGLAEGLGLDPRYYIHSPSFTLLNEYPSRPPLYHFDLYRLQKREDLETIGYEDYLYGEGIAVVEWAERLTQEDRDAMQVVRFQVNDASTRQIVFYDKGEWR